MFHTYLHFTPINAEALTCSLSVDTWEEGFPSGRKQFFRVNLISSPSPSAPLNVMCRRSLIPETSVSASTHLVESCTEGVTTMIPEKADSFHFLRRLLSESICKNGNNPPFTL